jgi:hypothetical protein
MAFVFPAKAIEFLRSCVHDPVATFGYEFISGSVSWSDERYAEFTALCRQHGCNDYGVLFAYRTSLLMMQPRENLRYAWDDVQERCPEWIGFRPERITPTAELQEYIRQAEDSF